MELLAILSTIILLGTIATLILAVAAYLLYKVRERRNLLVSRAVRPTMEQHVISAPVADYRALPPAQEHLYWHGAEAGDGAAGHEPRPAQAATYVPPRHLLLPDIGTPEQWEYGAEAFEPVRRNGSAEPQPVALQSPKVAGIAWL